jgi:diacylglycerol O-acyltransferase
VPVSVRAAGNHTANNQVAVMIAELPIGIADPVERLAAVRNPDGRAERLPPERSERGDEHARRFTPPMLYALGLRSATSALHRVPQRSVNAVTTNVPGPRVPLYALGREVVEYPP